MEAKILEREHDAEGNCIKEIVEFQITCRGNKCNESASKEITASTLKFKLPKTDVLGGSGTVGSYEDYFYPKQYFGGSAKNIITFRKFVQKLKEQGWKILLPEQTSIHRTKAYCKECGGQAWWK